MAHPPAAALSEGNCGSNPRARGIGGYRPHSSGQDGRPAGATHRHEPWVLGDPPLWGAGPIWPQPPLQLTCLLGPGAQKGGVQWPQTGVCECTCVHAGSGTHKREGGTRGDVHGCAGTGVSLHTALRPGWCWFVHPVPPSLKPSLHDTGEGACWPTGLDMPACCLGPPHRNPSLACVLASGSSSAGSGMGTCVLVGGHGLPDGQHRHVSRALRTSSPPPLALP